MSVVQKVGAQAGLLSEKKLEEYLTHYPNAFILISHDRYFLDVTVDRILEIWNKGAHFYSGNYEKYLQQKAERKARRKAEKLAKGRAATKAKNGIKHSVKTKRSLNGAGKRANGRLGNGHDRASG